MFIMFSIDIYMIMWYKKICCHSKKLHFCSNQQPDIICLVCLHISIAIARKSAKNQFTSKPLPTKHTAKPFKFGSLKLIKSKPIESNRIQTHQAHSQVNKRRKKHTLLLFFGYTTKPNSTKLSIFHSLFVWLISTKRLAAALQHCWTNRRQYVNTTDLF